MKDKQKNEDSGYIAVTVVEWIVLFIFLGTSHKTFDILDTSTLCSAMCVVNACWVLSDAMQSVMRCYQVLVVHWFM